MRFRASIDLHGKSATGIVVPPEVVDGLGSSRKPAVTVTINGYSYPSTVASMGGRFLLPVSAEVRAGAGVQAGDVVDIDVELDPYLWRQGKDAQLERAIEEINKRLAGYKRIPLNRPPNADKSKGGSGGY